MVAYRRGVKMYGIFVQCPDGAIECPRMANTLRQAARHKEEIGADPNWYGPEAVWVDELSRSPVEEE